MSFYRRNLPHIQKDYFPHFITFVTKNRLILPEWARSIVFDCCMYGHEKKYKLYAAVVMPDHVHLVLTPLVDTSNSSIFSLHKILRSTKSFAARRINTRLGTQKLWQEESFDRVLRSSESFDAKLAYILANPVRKGLVTIPEDYRWLWRRPIDDPYTPAPHGSR